MIELAESEPGEVDLISVSPLANAMAIRGTARWCLALPDWRDDLARASEMIAAIPPALRSGTFYFVNVMTIPNGVLLSGERAIAEIVEIASAADQFGEQIPVDMAQVALGITLTYRGGSDRDTGASLLEELHEASRRTRFTIPGNMPLIEIHVARERGRQGDIDGAIELARAVYDSDRQSVLVIWLGAATAVLVELLLHRGSDADLREARAAIAKLAALPTDPGVVLYEVWLFRLRALLAQAEGDDITYRDQRDRYRERASELAFEGHMAWATEMV